MKREKNLLYMLQSVDAFFPIGAFTLSNGLEDYVAEERIGSIKELQEYMEGFLQIFPYNDLGIAALGFQYEKQPEKLLELDALTNAIKGAREVRVGSNKMCSRYLKAREAMGDLNGALEWYFEQIKARKAVGFHPIAIGLYGASIGMELEEVLTMYGYSVLSAIVNNGVKLVPLSQLEGQRVLFQNMDGLEKAVKQAMQMEVQELGVSGTAFEHHCMKHEHLYSRQYMS